MKQGDDCGMLFMLPFFFFLFSFFLFHDVPVPTILRNVPGAACYFVLLNQSRESLRGMADMFPSAKHMLYTVDHRPNGLNLFISGSLARVCATWVFMPVTVIKTRLEVREQRKPMRN